MRLVHILVAASTPYVVRLQTISALGRGPSQSAWGPFNPENARFSMMGRGGRWRERGTNSDMQTSEKKVVLGRSPGRSLPRPPLPPAVHVAWPRSHLQRGHRCALLRASGTINWHPLLNRLKVKGRFNKSNLALRHALRMEETFLALYVD